MKTFAFEASLGGEANLAIPSEVFAAMPSEGKVKVLVCVDVDSEDENWREASYERFLRDDSIEDAVYDKYG